MKIRRIRWADGTPSEEFDLAPECEDDLAYLRLLERLRLLGVGADFIRASRARTVEERLASLLPSEAERQTLSGPEGLALLRLGPGMERG